MSARTEVDKGSTPSSSTPRQEEMPFAVVHGDPVTELPRDLYIPPHALEVFLEAFEGPLDLLLYLIKRQNLDILAIPIAEITRQYMEYIELMRELRLELAAEYLVMAAMLAEIKSRMLLPRHEELVDEDDPRAELVRRLQEYEQYKDAAESLRELPQIGRDVFEVVADSATIPVKRVEPQVNIQDLPIPLDSDDYPSFKRTISLRTKSKAPLNLYYRAAVAKDIKALGKGWYEIDGKWKTKVSGRAFIRKSGGQSELLISIEFKANSATITQEYQW